ncbi:uncharacterized protein PODANS_1_2205 [Podospora anserina S mat+]|uniref:Serine/threonine-protein phosphatase 2A activator n=1 Tax=Podospora anserina (strain S / ATCC MYA-4624 / DSM 980 / FGSC 10383) TaxID=515849 RepID=B2A9Y5_PODAN|nr:uncharacterized protein PODANS_1_2205 [Podospora anserina S mat+]CAP59896.1 unnamed protein product [Podospora anserina S mat+]CDP22538.1 Putative serine/threonine-protein phosphatase 2A [Podospora anserina S mat+]
MSSSTPPAGAAVGTGPQPESTSTSGKPSPGPNPAPSIPNLLARKPKLDEARRRRQPEAGSLQPVPETPPLPPLPDLSTVKFQTPTRRILTPQDHKLFLASPTYTLVVSFIFHLSESVADKPISSVSASTVTPTVQALLDILTEIEELCRSTPPDDTTGSRFGNKTFRTFLDKVKSRTPHFLSLLNLPPQHANDASPELSTYLHHSFGNATRIDYGSGHELNFFLFLLCLRLLSLLPEPTFPSLVLLVFPKYLELMRLVQLTYYLEPAGSHGVWGLDDYQFLPFLFGASQLLHHDFLTPKSIHQTLSLEQFGPEYLYHNQVAFVNSTKTVQGLRWHSPMLDDISAAKSWTKIEGGMRKMFVNEVLGKLPVMQHFLFGGLIPATEEMGKLAEEQPELTEEEIENGKLVIFDDTEGKRHVHQQAVGWGDCCGIKVPSSLAAAEEMRKRGVMGGGQLRRIPFD